MIRENMMTIEDAKEAGKILKADNLGKRELLFAIHLKTALSTGLLMEQNEILMDIKELLEEAAE